MSTAFARALRHEIEASERTQQEWARDMGISEQYLSDLKQGRRLPSVNIATWLHALCPDQEWHLLGARAHGWNV